MALQKLGLRANKQATYKIQTCHQSYLVCTVMERIAFQVSLQNDKLRKRLDNEQFTFVPCMRTKYSSSLSPGQAPKCHFVDGKDNMDAYLERFERYATSQKWPTSTWAINLGALLQGTGSVVKLLRNLPYRLRSTNFSKMSCFSTVSA